MLGFAAQPTLAVWRGCILDARFAPEYDNNHNKIVLLTAKQYAAMCCPQATPLILRTHNLAAAQPIAVASLPNKLQKSEDTDSPTYSEFLLWKKQRKESQRQDACSYAAPSNGKQNAKM